MALKSSEEFLRTALTNNTFDIDALDKALRISLDTSFSYLYRLQRNTVIYEEHFFTTENIKDQPDYGDFYLDKKERVCMNIPSELILTNAREKYRKSDLFREEISVDTLKNNHEIFAKFPVIILDNKVLKDFSLRIYDDYFTLITPFKKDYVYATVFSDDKWNYEHIEHTLSVQIINNTFYVDLETNTEMLKRNGFNNSFDRIENDYLIGSGVNLCTRDKGTLFAIIFKGDDKFGSLPQEVIKNEDGDYIVKYDNETLSDLSSFTGNITIRFMFYRYLYRHLSYHYDGTDINTGLVNVRSKDDSPMSELFLISDKNDKLYGMPVPTENLLIYKEDHESNQVTHFKNDDVQITYPNIYRVRKDVKPDDKLRVYYFYIPPYDLTYKYMYQFYYAYLKHKWEEFSLEKIVNMIYFRDYDFTNDSMLKELPDFKSHHVDEFEDPEGSRRGLFYEWELDPKDRWKTREDLLKEYQEAHPDDIIIDDNMTDEEKAEYLEKMAPIRLEDFYKTFDFIVNRQITDYTYDEIDYMKSYINTLPPLEYKTKKIQGFIKDNFNCLHDYILAQKQVSSKYEFTRDEVCLDERYTEVNNSGDRLVEPCYRFTIEKDSEDEVLTARIFVDGLFIPNFIYERSGYNDTLYLPVDMVPDDAKYFEIEVFPSIIQKESVTFTTENPSVMINFESTNRMDPTLSDLFFYTGDSPITGKLPKEYFRLEVISSEYNYLEEPARSIDIYRIVKGKANAGSYYDADGHFYTIEGQRVYDNDITVEKLIEMIDDHSVEEDHTLATVDSVEIKQDENYITFDKVVNGQSIIDRENKGVNFTILRTLKITAINADVFGKDVTVAVAKNPYYFTKTAQNTCFPIIDIHVENTDHVDEYTRVFRDGRLRSRNRYDFKEFDGKLQIRTLESLEKRCSLSIDVTPYRNRLIYYKNEIDSDLVNIKDYIDRPFDLKYFDVYLNGRKLSRINIFPISPYEFKLSGTHSVYNLEIYQKDSDWEYFDMTFDDYFTLSNLIDTTFMEKILKNELIHDITGDIEGNDNIEAQEPWSRENDTYTILFSLFFYNTLVLLKHLDPEINQFDKNKIIEKYDLIDKIYRVQNDNGEDVYLFNPDLYYKPDDVPPENERWRVFLLGNRDKEELDMVPEIDENE